MEIRTTPPAWLEALGWISLVVAFISAAYLLYDFYLRGYRQKMPIMEVVYPLTALYFGPLAVWFYIKYGRPKSPKFQEEQSMNGRQTSDNVTWQQTSEAVFHCGAGCTLGDIIGEWLVFAFGITIAGKALYADFTFDFVLAWLLGILFQYFTIIPMRNLGRLQGVWAAIKADTLSIVAFQVGLFIGMYLYQGVIFENPLAKTTASYWFLMQLSMILGFFTAYPVNKWLVKVGIKEKM
jgi:hypothetical protein